MTDTTTPIATVDLQDRPLSLTFYKNIEANIGTAKESSWSKVASFLTKPARAVDKKSELPLWCPTKFSGGERKGELAETISLFAVDIDNEIKPVHYAKLRDPKPPAVLTKGKDGKDTYRLEPVNTAEQVLAAMPGLACAWHTSYSHRSEWPKYRFAWPLSRDVTPDEYRRLWRVLDARFRSVGVYLDPATKSVSRVWYVPAETAKFESGIVEGSAIDVDGVLAAGTPGPAKEEKTAKSNGRAKAKAERDEGEGSLVKILDRYKYVRCPMGRVFARLGNELVPVDASRFAERVAREFHIRGGGFISKDRISTALLAFRGAPMEVSEVPLRVTRVDGCIYLDLGHRVVEVSKQGVTILDDSPVAFFRPKTARSLPEPIVPRCGEAAAFALEPFRQLLGVEGQGWHSCLAWLLSSMAASGTYTVLICRSAQGSGKSTRARLLRRTIDPRRPEMTGLPSKEDDLAVQAQNAHVLVFDNLRYLPAPLSDALCRLATGDGLEKRALYTDSDLVALEATRPILMTSIGDAAREPDLLDRSLVTHFSKVAVPRTEEEIFGDYDRMQASVLGALLFLCHIGLRDEAEATVPREVRMLGPARFAVAAEVAAGCEPGDIVAAYLAAKDTATVMATEDEFVTCLLGWVRAQGTWSGTTTELLAELEGVAMSGGGKRRPAWLPEKARGLTSALDKYEPALAALGVAKSKAEVGRGAERRTHITLSVVGAMEGQSVVVDPIGSHCSGTPKWIGSTSCSQKHFRDPMEVMDGIASEDSFSEDWEALFGGASVSFSSPSSFFQSVEGVTGSTPSMGSNSQKQLAKVDPIVDPIGSTGSTTEPIGSDVFVELASLRRQLDAAKRIDALRMQELSTLYAEREQYLSDDGLAEDLHAE